MNFTMKKTYSAPLCEAVELPTGKLMQLPVSGNTSTSGDEGGWSKKFWGVVDDDVAEAKEFEWEE